MTLDEILSSENGVVVKESIGSFIVTNQSQAGSGHHTNQSSQYCRKYNITIKLQPLKLIKKAFGMNSKKLYKVLKVQFYKKLIKIVNLELKRGDKDVRLFLDDMSNGGFEEDEEDEDAQGEGQVEHNDLNDLVEEDNAMFDDSDDERATKKKSTKKKQVANPLGESDSENDDSDEGGEEDGTLRVGKKVKENKDRDEDDSDSDSDDSDSGKKHKRKGAVGGLIDDEAEEGSDSDSDSDEETSNKKKEMLNKKKKAQALKLKMKLSSKVQNQENMTTNCAMTETKDGISFNLLAPARAGRVLMVSLAEKASLITIVKEMDGLTSAHVVERDLSIKKTYALTEKQKRFALFTEGCNFHSIWQLESEIQYKTPNVCLFDLNRLKSNDVGAILLVYGVEAARHNIVNEVIDIHTIMLLHTLSMNSYTG